MQLTDSIMHEPSMHMSSKQRSSEVDATLRRIDVDTTLV